MSNLKDIKIVEKAWMPEDTFMLVNERMSSQYDIQPLVIGKTKKENWLQRRIAWYRFKRKLRS